MLSENDLINDEVSASDDPDGMDHLIQTLYNEVARKRTKAIRLIANNKSQDAVELQGAADEMSIQLDKLIKQHMTYQKYLKSKAKEKPSESGKLLPIAGTLQELKNQKSSNGDIVVTVPKS